MNQSKNTISVLLVQGTSNLILFVVNCLSQVREVEISVFVSREFMELKCSNKVDRYTYDPLSDTEVETQWLERLEIEISRHHFDIIMPVDEFGIKTLITHKNQVSFKSKLCLLPDLKRFHTANNKGLLWEHMITYGISCPKTILYHPGAFHDDSRIDYPVIMKPLEGFGGGQGIQVFKKKADMENFYKNNQPAYPYLIQEFIHGFDIDCSVLCEKGKILAYTIQKGTLVGQNEFVPQIGLQFVSEPDLLHIVEGLMNTLDWTGIAHIDMRYDENDQQFKVLEINPRFWETTEASEIAGVNFPYLYLLNSLKIPFEIPTYNHVNYLNLLGLKKTLQNNPIFVFNIGFILNKTSVKYFVTDPWPLLYILYNKFKSLFK